MWVMVPVVRGSQMAGWWGHQQRAEAKATFRLVSGTSQSQPRCWAASGRGPGESRGDQAEPRHRGGPGRSAPGSIGTQLCQSSGAGTHRHYSRMPGKILGCLFTYPPVLSSLFFIKTEIIGHLREEGWRLRGVIEHSWAPR